MSECDLMPLSFCVCVCVRPPVISEKRKQRVCVDAYFTPTHLVKIVPLPKRLAFNYGAICLSRSHLSIKSNSDVLAKHNLAARGPVTDVAC